MTTTNTSDTNVLQDIWETLKYAIGDLESLQLEVEHDLEESISNSKELNQCLKRIIRISQNPIELKSEATTKLKSLIEKVDNFKETLDTRSTDLSNQLDQFHKEFGHISNSLKGIFEHWQREDGIVYSEGDTEDE